MRRVFADTYFLLALLNERDADHARSCEYWGVCVTTKSSQPHECWWSWPTG